MQTITCTPHRDFSRDIFWTKVDLASDDSSSRTKVLLCVSYEYLSENLKDCGVDNEAVGHWMESVIEELKNRENSLLFSKEFHFEVRAITQGGYEKGMSFLKEKLSDSLSQEQ